MFRRKKEEPVVVEPEPEIEELPEMPEPTPIVKQTEESQASAVSGPVKYEDLGKESKSVLGTMELHDGFRFEFNKTVGDNPPFGVSHAIALGSNMEPASYNFASNLMFGSTMLTGRIDTDGHMMARWHQEITKNLHLKVSGQAVPEPHSSAVSIEADYKGGDWFGNFKWGNPGLYGISYTQMLTPQLTLGAETFYHHKQGMSVVSFGGRYDTPKSVVSGILSAAHCSASYTHKISPRIAFSTELTASWASGGFDTVATGGFEYSLRTAHLKSHIDTNGKVTALVEEMLNQFTNITLCAELDHKKKQYHFGFGITMNL